jgi:hypothetical protein
MVTSACAIHQFKLTQSLVFRCHAETGACAMQQYNQTRYLVFLCLMVNSVFAINQLKQTQSLIFRCLAVTGACGCISSLNTQVFIQSLPYCDQHGLFTFSLIFLCIVDPRCAVNERHVPTVHLLCNLSPIYIGNIQHFFLEQM